jgi:cytochrome c2
MMRIALVTGMILVPMLVEANSTVLDLGEKIYSAKRCGACHVIQGKGGKLGPPLSDIASKRDAQWLKAFLKDPKAINPESKMSPFKGTDEELEALVAYLSTLK